MKNEIEKMGSENRKGRTEGRNSLEGTRDPLKETKQLEKKERIKGKVNLSTCEFIKKRKE